jgi:predicted dehydrogenase
MRKFTRRQWVKGSAAAVMACALPTHVRAQARGANGDIRLAVVGLRTRGSQLVDNFLRLPDVRIVALCDCDTQFFARELKKFANAKTRPRTVVDFRRLLDAKDVEALVVASPDHWHALMTVWACQAGKDVYVEKPISNNIWEGRQMVAAAGKYERIVQSGTQNRSDIGLAAARKFVQAGKLGKVRLARGFSFPRREPIGKVDGPQKPPATCDYNLYQGPAPLTPLRRKVFHYDWHWFWGTASGRYCSC